MCSHTTPPPPPPSNPQLQFQPSSIPSSQEFCSTLKQYQKYDQAMDNDTINCLCNQCGDKFPMASQSFSQYTQQNPNFMNNPLKTAQEVLKDKNISSFIKCAANCTNTSSLLNVAVCSLEKYQHLPSDCQNMTSPNSLCQFKMTQMLNDCIKEVGNK